jgi:hypothetical protein
MITFFFTWPPMVFATEIVLVEGPVMMKDEKSSLNCKRKKQTFSLLVYHIQNDCLKNYLTNILITSANLEATWAYFKGATFKIGAIFA